MTDKEIINRAKTLLQAYVDMFNSDDNYGELLSQCTVFYDEAKCDSNCLKDDMEILLCDIVAYQEKVFGTVKGAEE